MSYLLPYLASVVISTAVGLYAWRRRAVVGATPFAVAALAEALTTVGHIFELISPSLEMKIFWDNVQWLGIVITPIAYLVFMQQYAGYRVSRPKLVWGLVVAIPIAFSLLVVIDSLHGLLHPNAKIIPGTPFPVLTYDFNLIIQGIGLYLMALPLLGIVGLIAHYFRSRSIYRLQIAIIIVGYLIPVAGGILTLVDILPAAYRDLTPFTFAISNLVMAWGLFRYGLLDIIPVSYATVIERVSDGVLILDGQNRIVDLNPAMQRLLKSDAWKLIGKPVSMMPPPWLKLIPQSEVVAITRTEINLEWDGTQQYYEMQISPLTDHRGDLGGRVLVLHDITERRLREEQLTRHREQLEDMVQARTAQFTASIELLKEEVAEREQAERELLNSQRNLQTLFDSVDDFLFILDMTGHLLQVNRIVLKRLGYAEDELVGESVLRVHPPEQREETVATLADMIADKTDKCHIPLITKAGELIPVETKITKGNWGGKPAIFGVSRDITERKRAEELLIREKNFTESLINSLPGLFGVVDTHNKIIRWNKNAETLTGYPAEEFAQHNPLDFVGDEDKEVVARTFQKIFETGKAEAEVTLISEDGVKTPLYFNGARVVVDEQPCLLVTAIDISERKQAEDLLRVQRELGMALLAAPKLDETLEICLDTALRASGMDAGGIYLVDETSGIDLVCHRGLPPDFVRVVQHYDYDLNSPNVQLILAGEPIYLEGDQLAGPIARAPAEKDIRSLAIIPIHYEKRVIAYINLASYTQHQVPDYARTTLEAIATQIGTAISRSQVEEVLRQSEDRLRSTLDSITDLVFVLDRNGFFEEFYQPTNRPDLYVPPEQFLGKHFQDVLPPHVAQLIVEMFKGFEVSPEIQQFDYSLVMNNTELWYSARCAMRRGINGEFAGITTVVRNITEQKEATAALKRAHDELELRVEERTRELQESEELFRNLSEQSPNMIFINSKGRVVYVNERSEAVTGYRKEEFYAPNFDFLRLVAPDSKEIVLQNFSRHLRGEEIAPFDYGLITKAGQRVDVMMASKLITFRGEQAILGILVDITERKQAELQIKTSLEEKEALLKEVHHRVKNNLQVITSMLNMQTRYTQDEQAVRQLMESRNRVYSMALVHENLYRSETLAQVDIGTYISDLINNVLQSYGLESSWLELEIDVEHIFLTIDQAVPCGLIINELVSNALKHAFPKAEARDGGRKGKITIAFHAHKAEMLVLMVTDNGVGLPESLDLNAVKTLGLRLVRTLVRQLGATLESDTKAGATFRVTFRKTG